MWLDEPGHAWSRRAVLPIEIFYAMVALCCGYAWIRGGPPERWGAAIFLAAGGLTQAALSAPGVRFNDVEVGVLIVDCAMLVALAVLAVRAERFWPLWVTALQLIGIAAHAIKASNPEGLRLAYSLALSMWGYPMLLSLAAGTWFHQRRLVRFGADRSWSTSSRPSVRTRRTGPTA